MMSVRLRGESNVSTANAKWNMIESDQSTNDNNAFLSRSLSTKKMLSQKSFMVIKRGQQTSSATKYSYNLRRILQKDLKVALDMQTKSSSQSPTVSTPSNTDFSTFPKLMSVTNNAKTSKMRKTTSLEEVFSQDIEQLLKSLQSNEFVGTIDPQYHSRYVSAESLKEHDR